jgi:hypothetical protein
MNNHMDEKNGLWVGMVELDYMGSTVFLFSVFFSYNKGLRRGISRLPGFVEENSSHWAILHVLDIRFL